MATTNTIGLRVQNAKDLLASLSADSYIFVGRPMEWLSGDQNPPTPNNSIFEYYQTFRQMLSLKKLASTDVFHGIVRNRWTSGESYDMYSHIISQSSPTASGAATFYESTAVVLNQNNCVYVCLDNNGNAQSSVEPLSLDDEPFYTADGYQWLRLYNLSIININDNSTASFIPVATNPENDVVSSIDGAVYTVSVLNRGENYTSSPSGAPNQIPYYFCNIVGDGFGAAARVGVVAGSIVSVEVVRPGQDYTYATLDFVSGRVYQSLNDMDAEINGLNPEGDGSFRSLVIIQPPGGWGSDLITHLGASTLMVFSSLAGNESDFQDGLAYRQIGILKGASETNNATTLAATHAISVVNSGINEFTIGEEISQSYVDDDGIERTANGTLVSWDSDNSIIRYIQTIDSVDSDGRIYDFQGSNAIVGQSSNKSVTPNLEINGSVNNTVFTAGYADPEFSLYTGDILYLTNRSPILRSGTQTEKITLIIRY